MEYAERTWLDMTQTRNWIITVPKHAPTIREPGLQRENMVTRDAVTKLDNNSARCIQHEPGEQTENGHSRNWIITVQNMATCTNNELGRGNRVVNANLDCLGRLLLKQPEQVVWVLFFIVVGLGGARRSLLQEMPARLRFLLQIAETKA